jgi:hypothetical protein
MREGSTKGGEGIAPEWGRAADSLQHRRTNSKGSRSCSMDLAGVGERADKSAGVGAPGGDDIGVKEDAEVREGATGVGEGAGGGQGGSHGHASR